MSSIELLRGDCLDLLPTLAADSVDSCVTDPPYGLAFMGRHWDHGVPGPDFWREVYRVLKPGAHLAAFGGTRTYHRMACAIEDAGFEIRDSLMWIYGMGFPKSHDVSRSLDRMAGAERPITGTTKSGGFARILQTNEEAGFRPENYYKDGNTFRSNEPITPAARQWEGWGTALKPAFEPIVLARKPLGTGDIDVRRNVEHEIKSLGWNGEIQWIDESAASAAFPSNSTVNLKTSSSAGTFAANVGALKIENIETKTSGNSEQHLVVGTQTTDKNTSTTPSDDTTNCDSKSCNTTDQIVSVAANQNPISSHSTTLMAAEQNIGSLSEGMSTPTYESKDSPPDIESYAGIVTGLFDSMERVLIKREGNLFVWPTNLPTFVPSKPLTVAANVLRWRTGALNIDASRIEHASEADRAAATPQGKVTARSGALAGKAQNEAFEAMARKAGWIAEAEYNGENDGVRNPSTGDWAESWEGACKQAGLLTARTEFDRPDTSKGRWPANVVHSGEAEVTGAFPNDAHRFFFNTAESDTQWLARNLPNGRASDAPECFNLQSELAASVLSSAVGQSMQLSVPTNTGSQELSTNVTPSELRRISEHLIETIQNFERKCSPESLPAKLTLSDNLVSIAVVCEQIGIITTTISLSKSSGCAEPVTFSITLPNSVHGAKDCAPSTARFHYSAKASKADRNGSKHPTVKPISLKQWLARLITPPRGLVIDPFAGSGTTGAACRLEGFRSILIEREPEYWADIERRMSEPAQERLL